MRVGKILKYNDIKQEIKNSQFSPVYLLLGEEKYLKQEIINLIKSKIIPKGFNDDFNYHHFYSSDVSLSHIIEVCNTLPAFSDKRMVVVENIDKFKSLKTLEEYIKAPSLNTCLIICTDERSLSQIRTTTKNLKRVIFYPLFESQLVKWCIDKAKQSEKKLRPDTAQQLVNLCDNTLLEINNEMEKLIIYCNKKDEITVEDIRALIGDVKGYDVFKLIDAVFSHDFAFSLKIIKKMFQAGSNLYYLFSMLIRSINEVFTIKYLLEIEHLKSDEVMKQLGMAPYRYKNIIKNIHKYKIDKYSDITKVLFEYDYKFKSYTSVDNQRLFEDLIYQLCESY